MIDSISSIMSYTMARNNLSMSLVKNQMEAEAAIVQLLMEAAENIEQMASGDIGSNIDIYV